MESVKIHLSKTETFITVKQENMNMKFQSGSTCVSVIRLFIQNLLNNSVISDKIVVKSLEFQYV